MKKIKEKAKLRNVIKCAIGNTGSLDYVAIYPDGYWEIHDCSTSIPGTRAYRIDGFLSPDSAQGGEKDDALISMSFREIEAKL